MKSKFYAAILALLPITANAQPTVTNREQYGSNSVVQYLFTTNAIPGLGGANKTWNFSTLARLSGTSSDTLTEHVIIPSGSTGPYAGLLQVEKFSDSSIQYIKINGSNAGLSFAADSTTSPEAIYYAHPLINMISNMTQGATVTDTVTYSVSLAQFPGMAYTGKAKATLTVDAYGTLTLPTGTYNNVVRLKEVELDSIDITGINQDAKRTSYRWYNSNFSSPLLTVDSVYIVYFVSGTPYSDSGVSTQYLLNEHVTTVVNNIAANHVSFNGHIGNTELALSGTFSAGSKYTACIFNVMGQKVSDNNFAGGQEHISLPVTSNLAPGTYTILVMEAGKPETMNTIKAVKD